MLAAAEAAAAARPEELPAAAERLAPEVEYTAEVAERKVEERNTQAAAAGRRQVAAA